MAEIKIDKNKFYSPKEISDNSLFPWIGHEVTILNWIKKQVQLGNTDKYSITIKPGADQKHGNRYFVKGEGIVKIKTAFEDGSLFDGK